MTDDRIQALNSLGMVWNAIQFEWETNYENLKQFLEENGHFNVKNGGVIKNLAPDCIIESPGFVDRFGINMVEGITLPDACAAWWA